MWSQVWLSQENVDPSATAVAVSGSPGIDCDPWPLQAQANRKAAVRGCVRVAFASRERLQVGGGDPVDAAAVDIAAEEEIVDLRNSVGVALAHEQSARRPVDEPIGELEVRDEVRGLREGERQCLTPIGVGARRGVDVAGGVDQQAGWWRRRSARRDRQTRRRFDGLAQFVPTKTARPAVVQVAVIGEVEGSTLPLPERP